MTTSQKSSATISAVPITRPPWLEDAIDGTGILAEERMEEIATSMPTLHDLYVLDNRLDAQLDALRVCGAHVWPSLSSLLAEPSPGLLFMATVLGIENRDTSRLKSLLSVAEAIPELQRSLQAALSWVNPTFTRPLVQPLLASNIPFYWRTALHLLHQGGIR